MVKVKELPDREYLYGHKACPGCGLGTIGRLALKILGEKTIVALPASCMSTVTTQYPQMNYTVPSFTMAFAGTGAVLSGMSAGLKALGITDAYVLGIAGDGGTADIGLQALSGAVERGDDFIYICYDNEAYMNTGVQRSSLTPIGAATTNSPVGPASYGETRPKKNLFEIMIAHRIPYAATASSAYPFDFMNKMAKTKIIKGPKFIHVMCPCPTGWGFPSHLTVEIGKLAVETGLWYLGEYENGKVKMNLVPKNFKPVEEYLKKQRRFRHLTEGQIKLIQEHRDKEWQTIRERWLEKKFTS
ncbi:MAG: thiamine pyrophosphate-dependent enzyme [Thermodesulfobacteriota bacterium]